MDIGMGNDSFDIAFTYACAGTVVLLCLVAIIYIVLGLKQFGYRKTVHGNSVSLSVSANRDIFRVAVAAPCDGGDVNFERRRIRKGQTIEFVYPRSNRKAKLTVEAESGRARVYEV